MGKPAQRARPSTTVNGRDRRPIITRSFGAATGDRSTGSSTGSRGASLASGTGVFGGGGFDPPQPASANTRHALAEPRPHTVPSFTKFMDGRAYTPAPQPSSRGDFGPGAELER